MTLQDRAAVIELAQRDERLTGAGVAMFAGDFFEVLPDEPFDLVFCAGVAYTYGAERDVELYTAVKPLIRDGGLLAVHTFLRGHDPLSAVFAVQMLCAAPGADTHGENDHRRWFRRADYAVVDVVHLDRRPESLLLASP